MDFFVLTTSFFRENTISRKKEPLLSFRCREAISFYVIFLFSGALLSGTENKIPFYSRKHKFLVLGALQNRNTVQKHLLWEIMVVSKAGHCENNGILLISFVLSSMSVTFHSHLILSKQHHIAVLGRCRREKPTDMQ